MIPGMKKIARVNQYKGQPKLDWTDKQWLQHAWVQVHNPWINEEDREYWRDTIRRLTNR